MYFSCNWSCHAQIVQTPYSRNNLIAFVRLLSIPTQALRGCVHIMQIQMVGFGKEGGGMGGGRDGRREGIGRVEREREGGREGIGGVRHVSRIEKAKI